MLKTVLLCCLTSVILLHNACNIARTGEPTLPPIHVEIPYEELVLRELAPDILADPEIPGCSLADLRPFGWKEVDSGLVDIRTPEDYAIQTDTFIVMTRVSRFCMNSRWLKRVPAKRPFTVGI